MSDLITIIDPGSDDDRINRIAGAADGLLRGAWNLDWAPMLIAAEEYHANKRRRIEP